MFEVQGNDNASQLFEFLGNPGETTNVEWADVKIGAKNSDKSIVGATKGGKDYNAVGPYLLQNGYTIKEDNHSHVYSNRPSFGDRQHAQLLNAKFPNATLNNYFKGVYTPYSKYGALGQPFIRPIVIRP